MRHLAMLACLAVALIAANSARADTRVELLGTWPTDDAVTLHHNQNFYLHLRYSSNVPVRIWVQPLFEGKPVKAGTNTSRTYPAGNGEALGWFFLFDPDAQVDAVRITAGDGGIGTTPVVATFPVAVSSDDARVAAEAQPAWLSRLRAADDAANRADYEAAMKAPTTAGDIALFNGFMLAMMAIGLLSFAWPAWGLWRWRDGWRVAAALPVLVMGFVVLRIIVDGMRDPTSHNLWPFEILMWGGLGCLWMLIVGLAHKLSGAGKTA